jgi:hypothetical protein
MKWGPQPTIGRGYRRRFVFPSHDFAKRSRVEHGACIYGDIREGRGPGPAPRGPYHPPIRRTSSHATSCAPRTLPAAKVPGALDSRYLIFPTFTAGTAEIIVGQIFDVYVEVHGAAPAARPMVEVMFDGADAYVPVSTLIPATGAAIRTANKTWSVSESIGEHWAWTLPSTPCTRTLTHPTHTPPPHPSRPIPFPPLLQRTPTLTSPASMRPATTPCRRAR